MRALHEASQKGDLNAVQWLVSQGHRVDEKEEGWEPLHFACNAGHMHIAQFLIEQCRANVQATDHSQATPLHYATKRGHFALLKYLVSKRANPNLSNLLGFTPLHFAAVGGYIEIVKYLLEQCNANVHARAQEGTALDMAKAPMAWHTEADKRNKELVVEYLTEFIKQLAKRQQQSLVTLTISGNLHQVQALIETKCQVDEKNPLTGDQLIHHAAENGKMNILQYLVEKCNADPHAMDFGNAQPIHKAAQRGHLDIVRYLIERCNADIHSINSSGQMPLDLASDQRVRSYVQECMAKTPIKSGNTIHYTDDNFVQDLTNMSIESADSHQNILCKFTNREINGIIKSSGGKPLLYSMLMLVGQGRAGKTGLRNALLGKEFEETDSTLGVAQELLQIERDEVKIGEEDNNAANWVNFDRRHHQEQQDAIARVVAENLEKTDNERVDTTPIVSIDQLLGNVPAPVVNNETERPSPQPSVSSSSLSVSPVPVESVKSEPDASDVLTEEPSFKINESLVLQYHEKKQKQEPLKLTLWDFGGQEVFYSMHHLFLKRFGVYLVTFNMEWLAPQASEKDAKECLDLITFWLRSIKVHTQLERESSGAPVFLVGTHKDIVSDVKDHEHINKILFERFGHNLSNLVAFHKADVPTGRGKLWFYPVDNTKGWSGDRVISELMKDIEKIVRKEEYIKCKVPFEWMAVCDQLQSETRKSMTLKEFEALCKSAGVKGRKNVRFENEVQLILNYLSNLGMLMYHREAGLGNLVVTNPVEFLVGAASKIICDHEMHFQPEHIEAKRQKENSWSKMVRFGIVTSDLMKLLWSHEDYRDHTDELELLMVKFGLIVAIVEHDHSLANRNEREYFVPSLLDRSSLRKKSDDSDVDDEIYHEKMKSSNSLPFFIIFGMKTSVSEWQKIGVVKSQRVLEEGFLPHGILCRLIGKSVAQSQLLCDGAMDLCGVTLKGKTAKGLSFGDHEFSLREMASNNVIRVDVHVENSMVVMSSLKSLVEQVVSECVPNLGAMVAAGFWQQGCELCIPSHFMLVYGPNGLHDRVSQKNMEIPHFTNLLESSNYTLQSYFDKYLPPKGELSEYDVFISYRWGSFDSDIAVGLFFMLARSVLRGHQMRVFLDRQRLPRGKDYVEEFMSAMSRSAIVVPIVSLDALKRMTTLNCDGNEIRDNVLVEWTLALQLEAQGIVSRVYPIFVGELNASTTDASMSVLMEDKNIVGNLCNKVPTVVVNEVSSFLSRNGLKETDWLKTTSIKATVERMLKYLGTSCWDIVNNNQYSSNHGGSFCVPTAGSTNDNHSVANIKSKIYRTCSKNVMIAVKDTLLLRSSKVEVHPTKAIPVGNSGLPRTPPMPQTRESKMRDEDEGESWFSMRLELEKLKMEKAMVEKEKEFGIQLAKMEAEKEIAIQRARMESEKEIAIHRAQMEAQLMIQKAQMEAQLMIERAKLGIFCDPK